MIPHSMPMIDEEEIQAAMDVMRRGNLAIGPEIEMFESAVSTYVGKKYAVAVSNGTAAIHLALVSMGIGRGDEVILPASVCPGVMHAIEYTGAIPICADVNQNDLNLNFTSASRLCTNRTKLIILPHLFGIPSDIDLFSNLGVPLMEDCAQSIGAEYKGRKLGSIAPVSVFSFYATKMMTSIDGGMILTDSSDMAEQARDLRYYGGKRDYKLRFNYKLQNINAAVGLVQLSRLDAFIQERHEQYKILHQGLSNISGLHIMEQEFPDRKSSFYKFLLRFENEEIKNRYLIACDSLDIRTGPAVFVNLQDFKENSVSDKLKNLKLHTDMTYSFPLYPGLNMNIIEQFLAKMKKA